MSKITVTGGSGRVGANVVKHLAQAGHDVTACLLPNDRQEAKLDDINCTKVHFDITDAEATAAACAGADAVVHTAAVMEGMMSKMPPSRFFDINVKGGFNVLEGVRNSGTDTKLICFSSTATYDVFTCPRTPIKEDLPRKPLSLYGMNKVLIEEMVRQYHFQYDIPYTLIRPNYVVAGPEILNIFRCGTVLAMLKGYANEPKCQLHCPENPNGWQAAVPKLQEDKQALCVPRCCNGGSWRWHMTDVRDVVDLVDVCLVNEAAIGQTFNIAASDPFDWDKFVPYIGEVTGKKVLEVEMPNCWQFSFDQSASKELLGFEPKCDHKSIIDTAQAMADGEDVGIIPGQIAPLSFEAE